MSKYIIFLVLFSKGVFADLTQQEIDGWKAFNRSTAPGPETKQQTGAIIVNGKPIKGEVFISTFGEIYKGQNQINFEKTATTRTQL